MRVSSESARVLFVRVAADVPRSTAFRLLKYLWNLLTGENSDVSSVSLPLQREGCPQCLRPILCAVVLFFTLFPRLGEAAPADALFRYATNAYYAGDYTQAAGAFAQAASLHPAGGTLQNLGNAEWQRGSPGTAILAWEQSLWLDPFNSLARANLRFARRAAQLESPDLSWYEVVSSWLPANWWAWVAGVSLWVAVGISTVPGLLRCRRAAWHQAVSAFGLAVFLLSLPAHLGVETRARLGFVVLKDAPLRMTPTAEAQFITRLPAGEPGRLERQRADYLLIRTGHTLGWIQRDQFKLICLRNPPENRTNLQ